MKFKSSMIGVMNKVGQAYGVNRSLIEEGIFTIKATPLGPNLCLLEESGKGDLDALLKEGVEWKNKWFKEVRKWRELDVECFIAIWISIFGIPSHVRNKRFFVSCGIGHRVNSRFQISERKTKKARCCNIHGVYLFCGKDKK